MLSLLRYTINLILPDYDDLLAEGQILGQAFFPVDQVKVLVAAEFDGDLLKLDLVGVLAVDPHVVLVLEILVADELRDIRILNDHLTLSLFLTSSNGVIHLHRILLNTLLHGTCTAIFTKRFCR